MNRRKGKESAENLWNLNQSHQEKITKTYIRIENVGMQREDVRIDVVRFIK